MRGQDRIGLTIARCVQYTQHTCNHIHGQDRMGLTIARSDVYSTHMHPYSWIGLNRVNNC